MQKDSIAQLTAAAQALAEKFKSLVTEEVIFFHHNDTDGLTTGAILSAAFERKHLKIARYCLEKTYPEVLERIIADPKLPVDRVIVLADFASGILPMLSKINKGKHHIFVIDHHGISKIEDPRINLFNCLNYGISGSTECSASVMAYHFALALDPANTDLLCLGLLGAYGDTHFDTQLKFSGVNGIIAEQALQKGMCTISDGDWYFNNPHNFPAAEFKKSVDALGSFAYLKDGTDIAIKGLREGFDLGYRMYAEKYLSEFTTDLEEFLAKKSWKIEQGLLWFVLDESFAPYGVKTVGLVCEELISRKIAGENVVLGFQKMSDNIPGVGSFAFNSYKYSLRLPDELKAQALAGKRPGLNILLPEVVTQVGGFVDACHVHAAAATIELAGLSKVVNAFKALL